MRSLLVALTFHTADAFQVRAPLLGFCKTSYFTISLLTNLVFGTLPPPSLSLLSYPASLSHPELSSEGPQRGQCAQPRRPRAHCNWWRRSSQCIWSGLCRCRPLLDDCFLPGRLGRRRADQRPRTWRPVLRPRENRWGAYLRHAGVHQ